MNETISLGQTRSIGTKDNHKDEDLLHHKPLQREEARLIEKEEEEDTDRTDKKIDKSIDRREDLEHQTEIIMGIMKNTVQRETTILASITEGMKTEENRNPTDQTDTNTIIKTDTITMHTTAIDNRRATTPIRIDTRKFVVRQFLCTEINHKFIFL